MNEVTQLYIWIACFSKPDNQTTRSKSKCFIITLWYDVTDPVQFNNVEIGSYINRKFAAPMTEIFAAFFRIA